MKFANDTAMVGRIANNDESTTIGRRWSTWRVVADKTTFCINVKKTKEIDRVLQKGHRHLPPQLYIEGTAMEVVSSFRYLGVHISDDLTWSNNTSCLIRKAHQRLYFLRRLAPGWGALGSPVLTSFYRCVVEDCVGRSLSTTTDIYTSRCRKWASCIMKDPTHTAYALSPPPLQAGGCGALRAGPPD
ncbi:hypothetical protein L3Q82_025376 [Scortum barcoo]|uniref:Uncharacterized protein n=1 Tax=Scortum barcoo TaxID=214431 RepID=A0ACB8WNZ8_9TELE|nr:hypothetical protein L3Q82_025376 [Scortum barcoo]